MPTKLGNVRAIPAAVRGRGVLIGSSVGKWRWADDTEGRRRTGPLYLCKTKKKRERFFYVGMEKKKKKQVETVGAAALHVFLSLFSSN